MARCEFNPTTGRPATDPPSEGDCRNEATVSLGAKGKWHVCESCAKHPVLMKLRRKRPLGAKERK